MKGRPSGEQLREEMQCKSKELVMELKGQNHHDFKRNTETINLFYLFIFCNCSLRWVLTAICQLIAAK